MAEEPRTTPLVPDHFVVPIELRSASFRLEPLGPEHNARDHQAWMSSIAHLQATPGFEDRGWPPDEGFSAEQNLDDLVEHADEFERRVAFAPQHGSASSPSRRHHPSILAPILARHAELDTCHWRPH